MKLVGVELENFASLGYVFIPLKSGIAVLVGKNNSGKTALLHGLTLLNALPLHPEQSMPDGVMAYARATPFPLRLIFEVEPGDPPLMYEAKDGGKASLPRKNLRLSSLFAYSPAWLVLRLAT